MAAVIIMPKLGLTMSEGVVAKWTKRDGDEVQNGEPVAVVMSKKITYELKAPGSGILRVVAREKETRKIGAPIGFITEPGEAIPSAEEFAPIPAVAQAPAIAAAVVGRSTPTTSAPSPAGSGYVLASPAAKRLAKEEGVELGLVTGSGPEGMVSEADIRKFLQERAMEAPSPAVLATSAARKLAEQRGLDIARVPGTGVGGRVTEQDVLASAEAGHASPVTATTEDPTRVLPFAGMRMAIAQHMVDSLQGSAQLTINMEVDATELVKLREQLKADFDLTYTDLLVKAVAKALKDHPMLNASLVGDEIHVLPSVNVGVAVALPEGLIVPVIRDADRLSVPEIANESRRLVQAARDDALSVDEVTGGTFTITNLGAYRVEGFTPIINSPEVAILGAGRIAERPAVYNGEITKRSIMMLSLTIDHRIVDGAPGADFLRTVADLLESPYRLLV